MADTPKTKKDGTVDKRSTSGHARGLPKHRPTKTKREQVKAMAAFGIQHKIIAACIKIDDNTLRKYYADELNTGKAQAVSAIAGKVYNQAMEGCRKSQKLYLTTVGGWKTQLDINQTGIVGTTDVSSEEKRPKTAMEAAKLYKDMVKDL